MSKTPIGTELRYEIDGKEIRRILKPNILCAKSVKSIGAKMRTDREQNRKSLMELASSIPDEQARADQYSAIIKDGLEASSVSLDDVFEQLLSTDLGAITTILKNSIDLEDGENGSVVAEEILEHYPNFLDLIMRPIQLAADEMEAIQKNLKRLESQSDSQSDDANGTATRGTKKRTPKKSTTKKSN